MVLVGAEAERPYERPPLSKGVLMGKAERDSVSSTTESWYAEHGVDLRLSTRAVSHSMPARTALSSTTAPADVRPAAHRDRLLPRTLDVPGADGPGALRCRELHQSERLKDVSATGAPLVVIGAGWIGLEVAAAAREARCRRSPSSSPPPSRC